MCSAASLQTSQRCSRCLQLQAHLHDTKKLIFYVTTNILPFHYQDQPVNTVRVNNRCFVGIVRNLNIRCGCAVNCLLTVEADGTNIYHWALIRQGPFVISVHRTGIDMFKAVEIHGL
jgi:hypothetical protein